jgi:hypothetical protein
MIAKEEESFPVHFAFEDLPASQRAAIERRYFAHFGYGDLEVSAQQWAYELRDARHCYVCYEAVNGRRPFVYNVIISPIPFPHLNSLADGRTFPRHPGVEAAVAEARREGDQQPLVGGKRIVLKREDPDCRYCHRVLSTASHVVTVAHYGRIDHRAHKEDLPVRRVIRPLYMLRFYCLRDEVFEPGAMTPDPAKVEHFRLTHRENRDDSELSAQ